MSAMILYQKSPFESYKYSNDNGSCGYPLNELIHKQSNETRFNDLVVPMGLILQGHSRNAPVNDDPADDPADTDEPNDSEDEYYDESSSEDEGYAPKDNAASDDVMDELFSLVATSKKGAQKNKASAKTKKNKRENTGLSRSEVGSQNTKKNKRASSLNKTKKGRNSRLYGSRS